MRKLSTASTNDVPKSSRVSCLRMRGSAMIMVVVFAGVFAMSVIALLQFVLQQSQSGRGKVVREQALQVAEAGLEYYKWFLAHNSTQGSEVRTSAYLDPNTASRIGEFTITSVANEQCGEIMSRDVSVTGTVDLDDRFARTIEARYMYPSAANYSYIIDADVWAGSTRTIIGPYFTTGGVRMDATHNSLVGSGVSSWSCDSSFDCSPTQNKPGVFGAGSSPELWQYPVDLTDFSAMEPNFSDLKSKAQSSGRYFSSVSNGAGDSGYRIVFQSNGTFDVYRVTSASYDWGWRSGGGAYRDYHTINSQTFLGNYTVPSSCSLIYVEDQVWLEGEVSGKVALVAADVVHSYDPDVILHDDITYATGATVDGLFVVGENDVLVSARSPEDLTINGIFMAANGKFGRWHYVEDDGYYWDFFLGNYRYMEGVGNSQDLGTLTINGTVLSSVRTGTSWTYGVYKWQGGDWQYISEDSGFSTRINSYERVHAFNPAPFTPSTESTPMYVRWREESVK